MRCTARRTLHSGSQFREDSILQSKFFSAGAVYLLLGLSGSAWATPITILNAGFENPPTALSTAGNITGWVITGSGAGVWNLNDNPTGFWSVTAPKGKQVGFVGREDPGGAASISQVLTATLLDNSVYTLSGQVGHPRGFGATLNPDTVFTVELLAGSTVLSSISGTGLEGMFSSFQLTFNSTGSSLVGQALQIRLSSNQAQSAFDDILLNADAADVPEPSTFLFAAGAILALLGYRGWKDKSGSTR